MMNRKRLLLATLAAAALVVALLMAACSASKAPQAKFHCPMHPTVVSDKPGNCPICGMRLVPFDEKAHAPAPAAQTIYTCPMHPQVTSEKPGDCPICGMHLVPKKAAAGASATSSEPAKRIRYRSTMNPNEVSDTPGKDSMGMNMVPFEVEPAAPGGVPGLAPVSITEDHQKHMNLATSEVEMRRLERDVRTSARITPDETRLHHVTTKIDGWIEDLYVSATGQMVRRGQPLMTIYSPEVLATQQEYLSALATSRRLAGSSVPGVARGGTDLLEAARRRLELWDISEGQIAALETTGKAQRTVTLYSPASGYVAEKNVAMGHKIMPGEVLLTISDLSVVWAEADIYESDLRLIKVGMPVTLSLPYWPGKQFPGRISFLNPFLDPQTRTLKARLEIPNPDLLLKPEMYGEMTLSYDLGEKLAVPESALMRTGQATYVFLQTGSGSWAPTAVTTGERGGGYYEVLSGLKAGDRVVTSANFLVDSESSLEAALQAVAGR